MPWKWDPARDHSVLVSVRPESTDTSEVGVVWGNHPTEHKTLSNGEVESLLLQLAQQIQRLGFQV